MKWVVHFVCRVCKAKVKVTGRTAGGYESRAQLVEDCKDNLCATCAETPAVQVP